MNEEEIIYPLEKSLLGTNTVYVACEYRDRQQNYAICLNVIKAFDEKRRKSDDICCSEIKKKICPALKMRQEEISAGHTLYYIPRKDAPVVAKVVEQSFVTPEHIKRTDGYHRGWNHAGNVVKGDTKPVPNSRKPQPVILKPSPAPVINKAVTHDGSMAAMISQMAKDHANGVVEIKKEAVIVQPVKVETILEKARRIREQKSL